jgi:GNAT superfamily N-acetyltransferase
LTTSLGDIVFRLATPADMPMITRVRISVRENHLSRDQLMARGITEASVATSLQADARGFVATEGDIIVAFSIADRSSRSIFALFILPTHEQRGIGSRLLADAVAWLFDQGAESIWLTTGARTRAARFYLEQGWRLTDTQPDGQLRYQLDR